MKSMKTGVQQTIIMMEAECVYLMNTECFRVMLNPLQYTVHHNGIHVYKHPGKKINNPLYTDHFNTFLSKKYFQLKIQTSKTSIFNAGMLASSFPVRFLLYKRNTADDRIM